MFYKTSKIKTSKIKHASAGNNAMVTVSRIFLSCADMRAKGSLKVGACGGGVV